MIELRIERAACNGCGICVESCPTDVIRMDGEGRAYAAYPEDCQACYLCVFDCALEAISISLAKDARASAVSSR
ncbi:MAG TPA: 4Fe-4S binding protein [Dehalococcoidia bacterium]|nr:4Fe-4S binding protein [Dehalococcoidia bacterium]